MGIGPSTKETSLHHFRDPLLEVVSEDTDLDLLGLIIVGTPDDNKDKMLVGTRAAAMAECMRADGVIISSDGWGNSDVDYTNTCEQLGIRGIPVTGLNFSGTVAKFVVVNDYLDGIVDINKSADGTETDVVGENNMVKVDCLKAKALLKLKMRHKDELEGRSMIHATARQNSIGKRILRILIFNFFSPFILPNRQLYAHQHILPHFAMEIFSFSICQMPDQ